MRVAPGAVETSMLSQFSSEELDVGKRRNSDGKT